MASTDHTLLETGDAVLLETGDILVLETSVTTGTGGGNSLRRRRRVITWLTWLPLMGIRWS